MSGNTGTHTHLAQADSRQAAPRLPASLILADGTMFRGISFGAIGETSGEVVFNTSMGGYQEILTDPSYVYQMITFTYPHIGNVGVNEEDVESSKVHASGVIIRDPSVLHSNFRATKSLEAYLIEKGIVGIAGIDTRALVLHLRTTGAQMGIIRSGDTLSQSELHSKVKSIEPMEGLDLVRSVTCKEPYSWSEGTWKLDSYGVPTGYARYSESEMTGRPHVVAIDCGIKHNILRLLVESGFRVTVVPAQTSADEILKLAPNGLFISNGPGDPAAVTYAIQSVRALAGKLPIFGICLGHQILGLALGAPTFKLKFGHRGGNHPVRNELTGKVEITVQNHGFATDSASIPKGLTVSHINLNDGTIEGFVAREIGAISTQYHPECSPGPHDSQYMFQEFRTLVENFKG